MELSDLKIGDRLKKVHISSEFIVLEELHEGYVRAFGLGEGHCIKIVNTKGWIRLQKTANNQEILASCLAKHEFCRGENCD